MRKLKGGTMKYSNICPKCRCNDILKVKGKVGAYGSGNNIPTGVFSAVLVDRYICCNCGYSEEWIEKDYLPKMIKKYR